MKHEKPEYTLYDFYTKVQLLEIAKYNDVKVNVKAKKLDIAKQIAAEKGEQYLVPDNLTPAVFVRESNVKALGRKDRTALLGEKADMIDEQWRNVLSEEEFANRKLTNYVRDREGRKLDPQEKIAVYSEKNMFWEEVGRIQRGYNFMTREESKPWLQLRGVRLATPEEVALHFDL